MTVTDQIGPNEDFVPRELHPKPIRLDAIDPENVVIGVDRRSDKLLIHAMLEANRDSARSCSQ